MIVYKATPKVNCILHSHCNYHLLHYSGVYGKLIINSIVSCTNNLPKIDPCVQTTFIIQRAKG